MGEIDAVATAMGESARQIMATTVFSSEGFVLNPEDISEDAVRLVLLVGVFGQWLAGLGHKLSDFE